MQTQKQIGQKTGMSEATLLWKTTNIGTSTAI